MRRSWGYAFVVISTMLGLIALVMPVPETFVFEAPFSAVRPVDKKPGPHAERTKGGGRQVKPQRAKPPDEKKPPPKIVPKTTVSRRVTR